MPKMLPTDLCDHTPAITLSDNRGLVIRALAYNRTHANETPDELISRHRYNALGQLIASRDPRLEIDNFRYHYTLSGAALRTEGVDDGTSVQLADIEGRPLLSMDAKQTRHWVAYEPALGRPVEHQQQTKGGLKTITDRFFYGENSKLDKARNLNGQCIRHYDTAGLHQVDSLSVAATPLQQQFRLLTDTLGPLDWFGEEQSWASRLSGESFVTRGTTDALGQFITQTDAKGHTQRMAYNRAGQLIGSWLTLNGGREQEIVRSLTYSAAGQKLREESGNGVVTEYRYEAETQRLIGIKTTRPAQSERPTLLQDLRYDYDPVGNILAIHNDAEATRFYRNQKIVPETTYRYDALYQLIEATGRESDSNSAQSASLPALSFLTDGNQYVNYTRHYTYDRAGNLLKIQHVGASQYSTNITVSDTSNQGIQQQDGLTTADIRSQFDAAGNQQQLQPGQSLQWDARHQLQQVTTVKRGAENSANDDYESYLYGSDGMRVVKQSIQHTNNTVQTAKVTYLPGLELRTRHQGAELTEDFQVITLGAVGRAQVRVLLWQQGKPEGIDNSQLRYSFDNQIGSSLLELDTHGDIISQEEYYPFGGTALFAARNTLEAKYKTIRYSGKERDATGLYYYGFRYYMPWLGRWLSSDPAGTIDGLNLYRMVRNNPVGLMDEDGLATVHGSHLIEIFQSGDILYGLDNPRADALLNLESAGFKRKEVIKEKNTNILKTIKQHFRKNKKKTNILIQNDITNAIWDPVTPTNYSSDKNINKQLNDPMRAIEFKQFISSHGKYNIKDQDGAIQLKHEPYNVLKLGTSLWKKTSKAGLEFQLLNRKKPVHFMVDVIGDDINMVVSKEGHGASITSSEIRWLYRHRELPEVRSNLFFYRSGVKISHEDFFSNDEWKNYHPKHQYSSFEDRHNENSSKPSII